MQEFGCKDESISDHLKVYIKQGDITVIGVMPEGFSTQYQNNWVSPFENDSPGSIMQKSAALLQAGTGLTMKGKLNTRLVWEGIMPYQIDLTILFRAVDDPENEVLKATKALEIMAAPTLSLLGISMSGIDNKVPKSVIAKAGRNLILLDAKIENVNIEDPLRYTSKGIPLELTASMTVKSTMALDLKDLQSLQANLGA